MTCIIKHFSPGSQAIRPLPLGYGIHTNDSLCREVVIAFPWLIREGSVSMGNFGRGDIRLDRRGEMVLNGIVEAGSLVLRKASGSRAGEIAAHRFLDNSAVTHEMIIEGCAERTRKAAQGRVVIAVQDTTEINFSGRDRGRSGLGPAGDGKSLGFFIHPLLVVDAGDEAVLGLVQARIWTRSEQPLASRKRRPIEDKESIRWIEATACAKERLDGAARIVVVADREGDIYDHFASVPPGIDLIVRAAQDRTLVEGGALFSAAERFGEGFTADVKVPPKGPGTKARTALVRLQAGPVSLIRSGHAKRKTNQETLPLTLVEVREIDAPAGVTPLLWRLLTTLPADSRAALETIVRYYRLRWRIEQLFRVLKADGLKLEDTQLEARHRLFKLSALALEASSRIIQLTDARDGGPRPATDCLDEALIEPAAAIGKSLEGKTVRQQNPHGKGTLAWLAWITARLGGWNCYYKPPGPKTMAAGWQRLCERLEGFLLAREISANV